MKPLISVIVPTYNRAKTIGRTISSLLRQTYDNLEIIVVEDGSTDDTMAILNSIKDTRLKVVRHDVNKGANGAKNTGLSNIQGEWFTILDSDDEVVDDALEVMIKIPLEKDDTVTAVSCNCIDTRTGAFSGNGMTEDQYVDFGTLAKISRQEYWGITKTELLRGDRFNEKLIGCEGILWFKINERAKRFYVHRALRIYHTEGTDRISNHFFSIKNTSSHYQSLAEERQYLDVFRQYLPDTFAKDCLSGVIYLVADKKKEQAKFYHLSLKKMENYRLYKTISFFIYHSNSFIASTLLKALNAAKNIK